MPAVRARKLQEATLATNRFNQYGWNSWAYEQRPASLGITAYILCHVPEVR